MRPSASSWGRSAFLVKLAVVVGIGALVVKFVFRRTRA